MNAHKTFVTTISIVCTVSIAGCALPLEPRYDREVLAKKGSMGPPPTVEQARNIADAWTTELDSAVRDRHVQDVLASEVLFYGTLLFTAGSFQIARHASDGWRRARNVGAIGAAGSELFRSHYQPENQSLAFQQAATLMKCMTASLQPIPAEAEYLNLFDTSDKSKINAALTGDVKDIDVLYNAVPRQALHFIEQVVRPKLQADLKAISLGTPSKEELTTIVGKYQADKSSGTAGGNAATPTTNTQTRMQLFLKTPNLDQEAVRLRQKAVVSALASFSSELLLCKPAL